MLGTNWIADETFAGGSTGRVNVTTTMSLVLKPAMMGTGLDAVTFTTPGQHSAAPARLPS